MNKLALALCTLSILASFSCNAKPQEPIPQTWSGFIGSTLKSDIGLVKEITSSDVWRLCISWGKEARSRKFTRRGTAIREYLIDSKFINGADLSASYESVPSIGQTTCGVFAVLGRPDTINYTKSRRSTSSQMVYRSRSIYVYTDGSDDDANGIVRSVQF